MWWACRRARPGVARAGVRSAAWPSACRSLARDRIDLADAVRLRAARWARSCEARTLAGVIRSTGCAAAADAALRNRDRSVPPWRLRCGARVESVVRSRTVASVAPARADVCAWSRAIRACALRPRPAVRRMRAWMLRCVTRRQSGCGLNGGPARQEFQPFQTPVRWPRCGAAGILAPRFAPPFTQAETVIRHELHL